MHLPHKSNSSDNMLWPLGWTHSLTPYTHVASRFDQLYDTRAHGMFLPIVIQSIKWVSSVSEHMIRHGMRYDWSISCCWYSLGTRPYKCCFEIFETHTNTCNTLPQSLGHDHPFPSSVENLRGMHYTRLKTMHATNQEGCHHFHIHMTTVQRNSTQSQLPIFIMTHNNPVRVLVGVLITWNADLINWYTACW